MKSFDKLFLGIVLGAASLLWLGISDQPKIDAEQARIIASQAAAGATATSVLPSQAGKSGKFLTTDGSTTSWGTAPGISSVSADTAPVLGGKLDVHDFAITNSTGGIITITAPTTNIYLYSKRLIYGAAGTTPPDQYTDIYFKGQHSTRPTLRFDCTSGTEYLSVELDAAGGSEMHMGGSGGGLTITESSAIIFKSVGAADMQFAALSGNRASLGTLGAPSYAFVEGVGVTTNRVDFSLPVNGSGNGITNFSNLFPKRMAWSPLECRVVAGNALTYGTVVGVPESTQIYQNPPAVNDQTRIDGGLAAGTNYYINVLGHTANSRGIETWRVVDYLNNTNNVGTIDWYDAVGANGLVKTLGPFTLTNGGAVRVLKVMATKNGSSSDYYDTIVKCWIDSGN